MLANNHKVVILYQKNQILLSLL